MKKFNAFTMAEILLSLTIIGVVAAITLPSLTGNVNERVWNTQRKALHARFAQSIALLPQLNGYGEYDGTNTDGTVTAETDTAAETFITEGLAKVLKLNNICDATHLADCGIATSLTTLNGAQSKFPTKLSELNTGFTRSMVMFGTPLHNPQNYIDTKAAAFETQNGESVAVFYNPECEADLEETNEYYVHPKMCANFIYDLNGNKGPNTIGKDMGFITALYAKEPVIIAPMPLVTNTNNETSVEHDDAAAACKAQDSESRLPNKNAMMAMYYNQQLIGITTDSYWTGALKGLSSAWVLDCYRGLFNAYSVTTGAFVRCVKR